MLRRALTLSSGASPEGPGGGPAEAQGQKHGGEAVKHRMPPGDQCDVTLEAAFADMDLAGRRGEHALIVNQESFRRVSSDRDLAGDGDSGPVEHALTDL